MQTPEQARLTEELRRKMAALQAEGRPVPVPNLAKLGLTNGHDRMEAAGAVPAPLPYESIIESICGVADDSQEVEQYDGTLGVTTAFVAARQSAAAQVQWNDNLATIFTNPGNVSGVRWGSV